MQFRIEQRCRAKKAIWFRSKLSNGFFFNSLNSFQFENPENIRFWGKRGHVSIIFFFSNLFHLIFCGVRVCGICLRCCSSFPRKVNLNLTARKINRSTHTIIIFARDFSLFFSPIFILFILDRDEKSDRTKKEKTKEEMVCGCAREFSVFHFYL